MTYRKFLLDFNLDKQALNAISRSLDRCESGDESVLVSPIANEISPDDILSKWDSIFNRSTSKINDILMKIELSNRDKYGPRSIAIPWSSRREALLSTYGADACKIEPIRPNNKINRLRPISLSSAVSYLKNSSNSGLPYMKKKALVKDDLLRDWESLKDINYPCVLLTRTQENKKTRDVWSYPIADTVKEMMFYRPLLDYQSKLSWRSALSTPEVVDDAMTKLIKYSISSGRKILSIDFSQYDSTVKQTLQRSSFEYIRNLFQSSYESAIDKIAERFNTIELITPDGILKGSHGVPSGSTFTNEVDSIAQYLVAKSSDQFNEELCQIQGDDGVYSLYNASEFMRHFTEYGLNVNDKKSFISNNFAVYLQMLYHPDYLGKRGSNIGGVYPTYRALSKIVYLERFDNFSDADITGKDYFAIRTISILENCKNHPLFEDLVKFVAGLDKYKLDVSDLGLRNYVKRKRFQEGKDITFGNWTYGDDVTGMKNFETYKLIKSFV